MASAEIALVCGLKIRVGGQDRLCMNLDADETLVQSLSKFLFISTFWPFIISLVYPQTFLIFFCHKKFALQTQNLAKRPKNKVHSTIWKGFCPRIRLKTDKMKKGLRNLMSTPPPYNLSSGSNVPFEKSKSTPGDTCSLVWRFGNPCTRLMGKQISKRSATSHFREVYVESLLCNFFRSNMQAYIHKLHIYRQHKHTAI